MIFVEKSLRVQPGDFLYGNLKPVLLVKINYCTVICISTFRKNDHCMKYFVICRKRTEMPDCRIQFYHVSLRHKKSLRQFGIQVCLPDAGAT